MTKSHLDCVLETAPDAADKAELLDRSGADIPDPAGGGVDEYEKCLKGIERSLRAIIPKL